MDHHLATRAVTAGRPSEAGSPLNQPLVPASTFELGDGDDRAYARDDGTPTWSGLEAAVGALEDATAVSFASGMAAIAAVFDQLPVGARIAWPTDCYQGVAGLIAEGERLGRWSGARLEVADTDAWIDAVAHADLTWIESPSNPLLQVGDLAAIGAARRRPGALLAVDNTMAGPLGQRPIDLGADVAVQSATKHLGGHSDLLAGVATTRDRELARRLRAHRELHGATPGALESYLATRGIRTYVLRATAAAASALDLAQRLERDPRVDRVRHPGLASHPTHDVARRTLHSFGSLISFDVRGGTDHAEQVCRRVGVIRHATSFGAVESTIERRAAVAGQHHLPPALLRLSVGIEHVDDLWADLDQALTPP